MRSPAHESIILPGPAHLLEVPASFRVNRVSKAFFDQVGHSGQVAQDI
jgi:hypothetical protein